MKIVVSIIWATAVACSMAPLVGWNKYVFEVRLNWCRDVIIEIFSFKWLSESMCCRGVMNKIFSFK